MKCLTVLFFLAFSAIAQEVGIRDLLRVTIQGAPEWSGPIRIGEEGTVRRAMLDQPLAVTGMTVAEIESKIADAYLKAELLRAPVVRVVLEEVQSRPVVVSGAVRAPLVFQAIRPCTLLEALSRAGGLAPEAGPEILLTAGGLTKRIPVREVLDGDDHAGILLQGGEEIRVPAAGKITVAGSVKNPGAILFDRSGALSVMQALAQSGGLMPYAAKEAYLYRGEDGSRKEIPVPLEKILARKAEDLALAVGDILYIPDSSGKRVTAQTIERILSFGAGAGTGLLIYRR